MRTDNVGEGIPDATRLHTRYPDYATRLQVIRTNRRSTVIRIKAERSLFFKFGISRLMLDCLLFLDTLLDASGRESVPVSMLLDFSGKTRYWRADMYRSIDKLIRSEIIELIPKPPGKALRITGKGEGILTQYDLKFLDITDTLNNRPSKRWRQSLRP